MVEFDARRWLESLSQAARLIHNEQVLAQARRERMLSLSGSSSGERVSSTPSQDPMRAVDDVIDAEASSNERLKSARTEIESGRQVFIAMREMQPTIAEAATALEMIYLYGMSQHEAANTLNVSFSTIRRRKEFGIDWLDANGLPNVANGRVSSRISAV